MDPYFLILNITNFLLIYIFLIINISYLYYLSINNRDILIIVKMYIRRKWVIFSIRKKFLKMYLESINLSESLIWSGIPFHYKGVISETFDDSLLDYLLYIYTMQITWFEITILRMFNEIRYRYLVMKYIDI